MTVWIEEFLYRGRPPGSEQPVGWSVSLGQRIEDPLGRTTLQVIGPLTPEQAALAGYDIATVVAEINGSAMADRDRAVAERAAIATELAAALAARDAAIREAQGLAATAAAAAAQIRAQEETIADLTSRLAIEGETH